ncbi:MAG: hypothetical protein J6Y85_04130 [Alphaproteobacteria bacterium]|nr:hypothetical protein [Alphaproteobacteria bacterium]
MFCVIKYGLEASFGISMLIWSVAYSMVPPMIDAVPNCQWTGRAKLLVDFSSLVMQYPVWPLIFPFIVVCCGLLLVQYKNRIGQVTAMKLAKAVNVLAALTLTAIICWTILATFEMQEQMIANMGLDQPLQVSEN